MSEPENYVKKQTFFIGIGVALVIGFLTGIVFSVYKAPVNDRIVQQQQQQNNNNPALASRQLNAQQNPNNPEAWTRLGNAYFDAGQSVQAIQAYLRSLELMPDNLSVMTDLGVMYRRNKQPRKAIATFDNVLRINPRLEQALFNKGVTEMYDLHDTEAAIRSWKQLLSINPQAKGPGNTPISELISKFQNKKQGY